MIGNRQNVGVIYSVKMLKDGMAENDPRSPEQIGRRLRQLREAMNYGGRQQARFAKEMGLEPPLYNHYETGRRPITMTSALRISDRTGVPLDWILKGDRSGLTIAWLTALPDIRETRAG